MAEASAGAAKPGPGDVLAVQEPLSLPSESPLRTFSNIAPSSPTTLTNVKPWRIAEPGD